MTKQKPDMFEVVEELEATIHEDGQVDLGPSEIERRKRSMDALKAERWDKLNEHFSDWVREARNQHGIRICDSGIQEFCEEHEIDYREPLGRFSIVLTVEATIREDEIEHRVDQLMHAIRNVTETAEEWRDCSTHLFNSEWEME